MKCTWHRCQKSLNGKQTKFCSENCKNNFFVARRRKELKSKAIEYKGGKCVECGYNRCVEALIFHHVGGKDFGIAYKGYTRSWERAKRELDSCILVCGNCHAEIHAKFDQAAPFGNKRVTNQVNSGNPKSAEYFGRNGNPEPSPGLIGEGAETRARARTLFKAGEVPGSV